LNSQPQFIDLSSRPARATPRVEPRSISGSLGALREGLRRHEELYGGTARALRLHALPTVVPVDLASQLYQLCAAKKDQSAVEKLLGRLEADLRAGRPESVDVILKRLDVERLAPAVLVAALTITVPAKSVLREREGFLERVEELLRRSLGNDRAAALLATRR
jgi:hypothetical protein